MVVSDKKVVSVSYKLRLNSKDGAVVENVTQNSPLIFLYGAGHLLPKFEDNLAGLKTGDNFDFQLSIDEAYGSINPDYVLNIPLKSFEVNGTVDYELVKTGNTIPMQDAKGNKLSGIVKEIKEDAVTMDFNHPLAGNSLFFKGEITHVRQATEEEINHGHVHHKKD